MLNRERLRLTQLDVRAQLVSPPQAPLGGTTMELQPPALSAQDSAAIYSEIARYGLSMFQLVPGGVRIASADNVTQIVLTGAFWQYVEDLNRSHFQAAIDKLSVTMREFMSRMPAQAIMFSQIVDLQATWEGLEEGNAAAFVQEGFLSDGAADASRRLAELAGLRENASGVRLNFIHPSQGELPAEVTAQGEVIDSIDVRIEPFLADPSRRSLFLEATGTFAPTSQVGTVEERIRFVHTLLWEHLGAIMARDA